MADEQQLEILKQGVEAWNNWRLNDPEVQVDLNKADLRKVNLKNVNLRGADLRGATLIESILSKADLYKADLRRALLIGTNLEEVNLSKADLSGANLRRAHLTRADFREAKFYNTNCFKANISGANLTGANLRNAILIESNLEQAILTNCKIYGISAWGLKGMPKDQSNLLITPKEEVEITVDNLQLAQFIYLLLINRNIRDVIDTITSKVVLILGRFTDERKAVLDSIREELRKQNFTPILFDFDKPASKDVTGTVETLARMARFIIADLTDPSSIPHELATITPHLRTTPIQLIKLEGATGYSIIEDYYGPHGYPWVLEPYKYKNAQSLIAALPQVIAPANQKAEELRSRHI